jgi:large subunit ribosomal protein L9
MKVLLLKNVKNVGTAGHIVDVSQGFAQNKLIPSRLAKIPTVKEESEANNLDANRAKDTAEFVEWAKMAVAKLEGQSLSFVAKASEKGHLFGSIAEKEIVEKIKSELDLEISANQVHLEKHIKDLGDTPAEITLSPDFSATLTISVTAE